MIHPKHIPKAVSEKSKAIQSRQIIIFKGVIISKITIIKNMTIERIKPMDHANFFCGAPTYSAV